MAHRHGWGHLPARWLGRAAATVVVLSILLAGCGQSAPDCPDPCELALQDAHPTVTAEDARGTVKWRTPVDDVVVASPFMAGGHVILPGCRATHILDVSSGTVWTASDELREVVGVVAGQAVGVPRDPTQLLVAERLGGTTAHTWAVLPASNDEKSAFHASLDVSGPRVVGVFRTALQVRTYGSEWTQTDIALPVGIWPKARVLLLDDTLAVVPGSDGSVMGVDVVASTVLWRSHPTRPEPPAGLTVQTRDGQVEITLIYRRPGGAVTGSPSPTPERGERWRVDGRTGTVVGDRDLDDVIQTETRRTVVSHVRDDATGWTIHHDLPQPAAFMCE